MNLLYWPRRLYSLDTLDTRFTASANLPAQAAASSFSPSPSDITRDTSSSSGKDTNNTSQSRTFANGSSPSRWRTPEFFIYYVIFITVVPLMFKTVIDVSRESHPTYSSYSHLLSPGWIPGRKFDNSDAQYSSFRDNLPALFLLLIFHPLLRRVCEFFVFGKAESASDGDKTSTAATADSRLKRRTQFDYYFALLFILVLHGISAFKVLLILGLNYRISKDLPRSYIPAVTWMFNIFVLFSNELCDGYPFASIPRLFSSTEEFPNQESSLLSWLQWLDGFGGLMPRWQILFKVTILRLISFNMDYYWSLDHRSGSPIEKKQLDPASLSERDRVRIPAEPSTFSPVYYVAYVLYSPLYLTGPILTFNDYISQQRYPSSSLTKSRTLLYGIRFGLVLLCMELVLHYIYAVAISSAKPNWSLYTPGQLSMLGYFNLHIIWLKLLILWRFFRFWALLDGVDPPENMVRCMSNNYSALAFWRGWHRSFNRWVIRYLYVPLGGNSAKLPTSNTLTRARAIMNFLAVFTFVAIWHDINLRLLMWGWLITLFVLPEVIASILFPASRWRAHPTGYRVLCGIGAVGNILLMMMANLVGFAVGLDGLKGLLAGMVGSYSSIAFLLLACGALFVGVQVMFEIRQSELRAGIRLKC